MAKTRLNQSTREALLEWMKTQAREKTLASIEKPLAKAIEACNIAIREKYPESEMVILRKYSYTGKDRCLRFVNSDGQVFGVDFGYEEKTIETIADMPRGRGCRSNDVFAVSKPGQKAIEAFTQKRDEASELLKKKYAEYRSFVYTAKNVEDIDEVIPLPEDMRKQFMSGAAVVAINPDVIASIKADFEKAA